jgi:serine/threonine protein kinase
MDETPELFLWHAFKHITNGLGFIHGAGFVHGDIKPGNKLLTAAQNEEMYPMLKIADFVAATIRPPNDILQGHHGTYAWMPPEAAWRYGPESDR